MQALQFSTTGSLDALQLCEVAAPPLAAGEVRVEVRAAGVNPSDVKNVLGRFPYTQTPRIPGRDFAGVVIEGPDEWLGQAVWGGSGKGFGFTRDGCHAAQVCLPIEALARLPAELDFARAATCGVPYLTAWDALSRTGVEQGARLLIIGAGAVAQAAADLALARGAQVCVAARRREALAPWQARTHTLLLGEPTALAAQVQEAFAGVLPEVIFDTTGFWLAAAVPALATFGRLAVIAAPVSGQVEVPVLDLYRRGGVLVGVNSLLYSLEECARHLQSIGALFAAGQLPLPALPQCWPLSRGVEAYRAVEAGSAKIVLIPD